MRIELPNFDEVGVGFEPIQPGRYSATVTSADVRATKDGSGKLIVWELTILGPTENGRRLWLNTALKKEALWNLKGFLSACGAKFDEGGFNTEDVIGLKVDINVEQEEYPPDSNVLRNRIVPPYYPCSLV